jgi:hypothetical protein
MDVNISKVKSRDEMIHFLEGHSLERKEDLDQRKMRKGLLKSYLLETLGDSANSFHSGLFEVFKGRQANLELIDDDLYTVFDNDKNRYVGFLEKFMNGRFLAYYTTELSRDSDPWVKNLVLSTPYLDHVWLSGWTFNVLWEEVKALTAPHRYVQIVFEHESIFEIDNEEPEEEGEEAQEEPEGEEGIPEDSDETQIPERRKSRFVLVDKKYVIEQKLTQFQNLYPPLHSITRLLFPSPVSAGGHDFWYNGKVTNRSESFRDHRSHLTYVLQIYGNLVQKTEDISWCSIEEVSSYSGGVFHNLVGSPLTIKFSEPLSQTTFDFFIKSTFTRRKNRFRLWGNPLRLGPRKVHVYGVDKHLWQPIFLEITDRHMSAIVPKGTCGNTVHRIVTNIQRFLDPAARAYLGEEDYNTVVKEASRSVVYG